MPKKRKEREAPRERPKLKALKGELKGEPQHHGSSMKFEHGAHHAPRKMFAHKSRAA